MIIEQRAPYDQSSQGPKAKDPRSPPTVAAQTMTDRGMDTNPSDSPTAHKETNDDTEDPTETEAGIDNEDDKR